jgi:lipoprotein-anchoring transpeptidase ErfK/SrfK
MLLGLTAAIGVVYGQPTPVEAGWVNGSPVFRSDVEKREQARDAARTERRKKSAYQVKYPRYMKGGEKPDIQPEKPAVVYLEKDEQPGTIIVDTKGRQLLYVLPGKRAYAYPISVGRQGFTWTGTERISRIQSWPSWTPPPEMRRRQPGLPITVSGGVINPLGAKALYLGSSIYRIHGTNNKRSIGRASSSGCFRMMNKHVTHLATLARIGTKVRVVSSYSGVSASMPLAALFGGFNAGDEADKAERDKSKKKR